MIAQDNVRPGVPIKVDNLWLQPKLAYFLHSTYYVKKNQQRSHGKIEGAKHRQDV